MNILLTSVGRRSYLVNYFKKELNRDGKVHVMNSSDLSPAFVVADCATVSPLIYDKEYIPFLLNYCQKNNIRAIIPLLDIDVPVLATAREQFEKIGTELIVASADFAKICNDKWLTYRFLKENDFHTAKSYIDLEKAVCDLREKIIEYPVIVKPRWGMGSIAVYEADDEVELRFFYEKAKRNIMKSYLKYESQEKLEESVLIQQKLKGQEYGMDIMNDLSGKFAGISVKMKYAMRSGETDCAITVDSVRFKNEGKRLSEISKHIGNLDVDVFEVDDTPYILEMNARFGGGYPFSHIAGVNLPKAIIQWLNGEAIDPEILKPRIGVRAHKDIEIIEL